MQLISIVGLFLILGSAVFNNVIGVTTLSIVQTAESFCKIIFNNLCNLV